MQDIKEIIGRLPVGLRQEVLDFAENLLNRHRANHKRKPRLDWAGCLANLKDKYTSVELQHKISRELRGT